MASQVSLKSKTPIPQKQYLRDGRAPLPARESTSRAMSANRGKGTRPELRMRQILHASGVPEFQNNPNGIPGRPDIAFTTAKVAIFVHGCFWHRCPHCRPSLPRTHRAFWGKKFRANKLRDARKARILRTSGWRVLTVWECQVRERQSVVLRRVLLALESKRGAGHATSARLRPLSAPGTVPSRSNISLRSEGLPPRITASAKNAAATS
jgi:DNA mismatch endonuclease, patch repair protein